MEFQGSQGATREGALEYTALTLPLIHKAHSVREPDKQHYYYHQSLRTKETEAAEGVVGCSRWLIQ